MERETDTGGCFAWMTEQLEIATNPYRSRNAGTVPTDVTNQIIQTQENWKREWNFKCHVPKVWYIARKRAARIGGVWDNRSDQYLARHNAALMILFFKMLKDLELISELPPWHSKTQPKPLYENGSAQALWEVPVYADSTEVRANRIDARIVDKEQKRVLK